MLGEEIGEEVTGDEGGEPGDKLDEETGEEGDCKSTRCGEGEEGPQVLEGELITKTSSQPLKEIGVDAMRMMSST